MAEGRDAAQGRSQRGDDGLGRRVAELERQVKELAAQIAQLQSPLVDCAYCGGTSKQPNGTGGFLLDNHNRPIPCQICAGRRKVRV